MIGEHPKGGLNMIQHLFSHSVMAPQKNTSSHNVVSMWISIRCLPSFNFIESWLPEDIASKYRSGLDISLLHEYLHFLSGEWCIFFNRHGEGQPPCSRIVKLIWENEPIFVSFKEF